MNGGLTMVSYLMDRFSLSKEGSKDVLVGGFYHFLSLIFSMLPFILLMYFAEDILERGLTNNYSYIALFGAIILIGMELINLIDYNASYTNTYVECRKLRLNLCESIRKLPLSYYTKHNYTDVSQALSEDTCSMELLLSHILPQMIGLVPFLILSMILLIANQILLGSVISLIILISFGLAIASGNFQKRINSQYYIQLQENSAAFQSFIDMQKEIRSFNLTNKIKDDLDTRLEESEKFHFKVEMKQAIFVITPYVLLDLTLGLVIFFGSFLVVSGQLSILFLIAYILVALQLSNSVKQPIVDLAYIYYLDARIKRFKEFNSLIEEEGSKCNFDNWDIEFRDVCFNYNEDRNILNGINMKAKQGEITALVGPSGCGKTTLLRLLARLYDSDSGFITIGGIDISKTSTESLYDNISIVFQNVTLFNGTVFENIALGKRNCTEEEVYEASKLAGCDQFIQKLPEGYDTQIGENGSSLSGGERQRISIARALLKDAPIILLDEITSNLDIENEKWIQGSLETLIANKTTLIVSHRMKSIQNVDKIIVLDDGCIESWGTHDDLMRRSKLYKDMIKKSELTDSFKY